MVFHYFRGRQGGQSLKIHYPPPPRRAQTRTHFIRSIAPRVLISPPITLVSVLSGIRQNPSVQALFGELTGIGQSPQLEGAHTARSLRSRSSGKL